MPKMGESIMEATILTWLKKEGDKINQDESVLEVATDKVDTEVPATHGGILKEILAKEGDVVEVGKPIAVISTESETDADTEVELNGQKTDDIPVKETSTVEASADILADAPIKPSVSVSGNGAGRLEKPVSGRFYSPLVLNIARQENISMSELVSLPGSGKEGRFTKKDILAYIKTRSSKAAAAPTPSPTVSTPAIAPIVSGHDEIIEMDRLRLMIADRMVESKRISPHVTSFVEADVTRIVKWRDKVKTEYERREGEKLTYTPIFIEAVIKALKDFPMVNISVDGSRIILHKDIHIGLAVALPSGNLIVPVIRNADQLSLIGLSKKVNNLAKKARESKLVPDELSGGTYTISNVGSFGNVMGTPIIVQPQVAIMAVGAITKKPAVIETPEGDWIGIRHKMFLSHSYDHRVVDGALGGMFVRKVADYLENFDIDRVL